MLKYLTENIVPLFKFDEISKVDIINHLMYPALMKQLYTKFDIDHSVPGSVEK